MSAPLIGHMSTSLATLLALAQALTLALLLEKSQDPLIIHPGPIREAINLFII